MSMNVDDGSVERVYLDQIERAVAARDAEAAHQIRAEIAAHIAESRSDAEQRGEVTDIRDIIAEIGDPLVVAAEVPKKRYVTGPRPSSIGLFTQWDPMTYVWAVCLLIAIGSAFYFTGWALGLVMVWTSSLWTTRIKIWASALVPGVFLLAFLWFDFIFVAGYVVPVIVAVLLYFASSPVKARRRTLHG